MHTYIRYDHANKNNVSIRCGSVISVSSDEEDSLLKELNMALETDTESWEDCKERVL